jgi:hypothetical protein
MYSVGLESQLAVVVCFEQVEEVDLPQVVLDWDLDPDWELEPEL